MIDDPLWYKDAILYEVHVRAFHDGNGDGIGDFPGLIQKLDYLADLGITALWLLPFAPSPLRDDGYDIADFTSINPAYGTLEDFQAFLNQAHNRGIRVITELVINHTSDQHPWFQRARRAPPGSRERNFYVWSDTSDKYPDVPLMFPDFETSNWTWDPIARQYYWHRFYNHQPDLNFDSPDVREALLPVIDFWFEMGVDGMRLDAVPYLFEREGTTCEHLPETHAFLKSLRRHVEEKFPNRMFLAEANAWPEDMVAYFGAGDECQMAFHFPLMPRLFMALHQEDSFPITDVLAQTPVIPENCQWCLFLRNHDELTLAMVTDEERDAMYTAYTQDRQARLFLGIRHRLAPLLKNDRRRIELMNAMLFSLPGTPVIYYGDEIGMGDNIYLGDRNGVRTPMQWSDDRNAGFSRANSQKLYLPVITDSEYHYEAVNVETQQENPSSLLWWTKRLIGLRKRFAAFGRGDVEILTTDNSKVLAFARRWDSEHLLIVANLSRFVQHVNLDLRASAGMVLEEVFGRTLFPPIREEPYPLTLGPHAFYWFSLVPEKAPRIQPELLPVLPSGDWSNLVQGRGREALTTYLAEHYANNIRSEVVGCRILDFKTLPIEGLEARMFTIRVDYSSGLSQTIYQPLCLVPEERFSQDGNLPHGFAVARIAAPRSAILCDPIALPEYATALAEAMTARRVLPLSGGAELICKPEKAFAELAKPEDGEPAAVVSVTSRHRLTVVLGHRLVLRSFRRAEEGENPDVEIGRFLHNKGFNEFAEVVGTIEYRRGDTEPITLAAWHRFVPNQGTAWQVMLDHVGRFFEAVAAQSKENPGEFAPVLPGENEEPSDAWEHLVSPYIASAQALGAFTARLHLALASAADQPAFVPTPVTAAYQRSYYQSLRNLVGRIQSRLADPDPDWSQELRDMAARVRGQTRAILGRIRVALDSRLAGGRRIRCHGDLHLGQLLVSGRDFVLSDLEGDPLRPISERRIKRSPLCDVAALIRSLDYVANSVRLDLSDVPGSQPGVVRPEDREQLEPYTVIWQNRLQQEFLNVYWEAIRPGNLLPESETACRALLDLSLWERILREIDAELADRPAWAVIPLAALLRFLGAPPSEEFGRGYDADPRP